MGIFEWASRPVPCDRPHWVLLRSGVPAENLSLGLHSPRSHSWQGFSPSLYKSFPFSKAELVGQTLWKLSLYHLPHPKPTPSCSRNANVRPILFYVKKLKNISIYSCLV